MALDAHVVFLSLSILWLTGCVFVGSLLKLGGAGMTACYRFHPDFVVLPWLVAALAIRHIYLMHNLAFWAKSLAWYVSLMGLFVWRFFKTFMPVHLGNNYWPDRGSLHMEWVVAAMLASVAVWLVYTTRIQWRQREIGGIR